MRQNRLRPRRAGRLAILVALALLIAGCADDADDSDETVRDTAPRATATPAVPTNTLAPTGTFPPTWTPAPTLTEPAPLASPALATARPTATPFDVPTYTPSPIRPSATPRGPVLTLDVETLDSALRETMNSASGDLFVAPPEFTLRPGELVATVQWLQRRSDAASVRTLAVRMALDVVEGRIEVTKVSANFTDDNAVYDTEDVNALVDTIEQVMNEVVLVAYGDAAARFAVLDVTVTREAITVETIALE